MGVVFYRLSMLPEFRRQRALIQSSGIGSMVYSCFAMTPLHDTVVTISVGFFIVAGITLIRLTYLCGQTRLSAFGVVCLVVLGCCATMYYSGRLDSWLAWSQRTNYAMIAAWVLAIDHRFVAEIASVDSEA